MGKPLAVDQPAVFVSMVSDEHVRALRKRYDAAATAYQQTGTLSAHQAMGEAWADLTAAIIWQRYSEPCLP